MKEKYSNIIIFATYWNEIEWIKVSLEQIDLINPRQVIICDGCYDPRYDNHSTDGTTKIIDEYCRNNPNAIKINAIRKSKFKHALDWLWHKTESNKELIAKFCGLYKILRTNIYRLNQMATFQAMLDNYSKITVGDWFMTYDCDQFYSDEIIKVIKDIHTYEDLNILTCKENTFFNCFQEYSDNYEKRDYNNMPHRYLDGLRFIPTRHPARVYKNRYMNCSDFDTKKQYIGEVYHYQIKSPKRKQAGYSLGDRKPPEEERMKTRQFVGKHPIIIQKYFKVEEND